MEKDLEAAGDFLKSHVPMRYHDADRQSPYWLSQGAYDALSCLYFDLGEEAFRETALFEKLNSEDALPTSEEIYTFGKNMNAEFYLGVLRHIYSYTDTFGRTERLISKFDKNE